MQIRIRWKVIPVAAGVVIGVLADPNAVGAIAGALPARAAHILLAVSAIAAIFSPAGVTNRPKSGTSGSAPADPLDPPSPTPAPNDASNDFARGE